MKHEHGTIITNNESIRKNIPLKYKLPPLSGCFRWCLGDEFGLFTYRSGVNLEPALFKVREVSISSASRELRQGTVGIDCFLLGKLPGSDILSFEPLFRRGL